MADPLISLCGGTDRQGMLSIMTLTRKRKPERHLSTSAKPDASVNQARQRRTPFPSRRPSGDTGDAHLGHKVRPHLFVLPLKLQNNTKPRSAISTSTNSSNMLTQNITEPTLQSSAFCFKQPMQQVMSYFFYNPFKPGPTPTCRTANDNFNQCCTRTIDS